MKMPPRRTFLAQGAQGARVLRCLVPIPFLLTACGAPSLPPQALAAIPEPVLERMEPAVREQLGERRRNLDAARARDAPPTVLAREFGELGRLYHAYDLLQAAEPCYQNAQALVPGDFRWPYYLGILYQTRGQFPQARESFERALELRPQDLPVLLRLGDVHLEENQLELARGAFERALEVRETAAVHYGLGRVAQALDRSAAAAEHLAKALDLEPQATGIHYLLALAYRELGALDEAQFHLERQGPGQITVRDPLLAELVALSTSVGLFLQRGGQAQRSGQAAAAVREYEKAVQVDPESAPAHQSLASALAQTGDSAAALRHYRRALELDPKNAIVAYNLGILYKRRGIAQAAERHLQEAIGLDPALIDARLTMAALREQRGHFAEAGAQYAEVLKIDPQNVTARARSAMLLVSAGQPQQAVKVLQTLEEEAPNHPDVLLNLGSARAASGELAAAADHFRQVLALQVAKPPEKALAHANLAAVLERQESRQEAIGQYRAALDLNPGLTAFRFALANLLGTVQRYDEAADEYARVIELEPANEGARRGEATALVLAGRYEKARAQLERGLVQLPRSGALAHALARLLATCPDPRLRDGTRALALAQEIFTSQESLEHAETVAMALAELRRFDEATQWQRAILHDATALGDAALLERLQRNLHRYTQGHPSEATWLDQDPR